MHCRHLSLKYFHGADEIKVLWIKTNSRGLGTGIIIWLVVAWTREKVYGIFELFGNGFPLYDIMYADKMYTDWIM